ncbi:MAG: OmpA family protein [Aureispira sp.]
MKKIFLGCLLLLCCAVVTQAQEEAIKDSMEVYFKLDRANLLNESQEAINAAFEKNQDRIIKVRVAGHTCDLGSDNYNMGLSERRANAAFEYVKTLGDAYQEKTELFFYGEKEQKYDDRDMNRRVYVLFYLEDDDRDTLIEKGCASVFVEKGTFKPNKTKEASYEFQAYNTGDAMKARNLSIEDTEGRKLYFNSVLYFQAMMGGNNLTPVKTVKISLPLVNADKEGYMLYEGMDQGGKVVWKNTGKPCQMSSEASCETYNFDWMNTGYCACAMPRACQEDCNPDPFSGVETPDVTAANVRASIEKTTFEFEDGTYADFEGVTVIDDNQMESDLTVCEQFKFGIVSDDWYPNRHKMTDKKNINVRSSAAPADKMARVYVVKKNISDMSDPVLLVGETHSAGYPKYVDQVVRPTECLGPVNCEYIVYDVPARAWYKLGEWDDSKTKPAAKEKWILKVRLLKSSTVFIGNTKTNEVYKAGNAERKGKTRPKEYTILEADNPSDLVVYVQNATKKNFKLYQAVKLTDLKYKKASNMYIMRRVKFKKTQSFDGLELEICKDDK